MLPPPPVLALAATLAQRALSRGAHPPTVARALAATSIAMASGALAGAAAREFGRVGTTKDPMHPDRASTLVTTGANAVSRNPMYVAWTLIYVGIAFVANTAWPLILLPLLLLWTHATVLREERRLKVRFGPEYQRYTSWRWWRPRCWTSRTR